MEKVAVHLETPVVDVPVTMQLKLQQSIPRVLEVPQIQFNDRVLQLPVASQTWVPTVQTVLKTVRSNRCSSWEWLMRPLLCNDRCPWSRQRSSLEVDAAVIMQRQVPADRWRWCRRCSLVVDVAVSMQRQVPAAPGGAQTSSSTKSWIASEGDF